MHEILEGRNQEKITSPIYLFRESGTYTKYISSYNFIIVRYHTQGTNYIYFKMTRKNI